MSLFSWKVNKSCCLSVCLRVQLPDGPGTAYLLESFGDRSDRSHAAGQGREHVPVGADGTVKISLLKGRKRRERGCGSNADRNRLDTERRGRRPFPARGRGRGGDEARAPLGRGCGLGGWAKRLDRCPWEGTLRTTRPSDK